MLEVKLPAQKRRKFRIAQRQQQPVAAPQFRLAIFRNDRPRDNRSSLVRGSAKEAGIEVKFLAVPNAKLAGEHLKTLTAEPHVASSPEDHKTAEYVAEKFRAAGLDTEIVPYRVLMNQPKVVKVEAFDAAGKPLMSGPTPEHVGSDPFENDPRVLMPFNGSSGSGDVTGEAVYANYGRLEDFDELAKQHVDLHGKIVIVRYGANFRGVKVYIAEQRGAIGVLIYSDPQDDGFYKGDPYPPVPGGRRPAYSAGLCNTSSSIPVIRKHPELPRLPICLTRRASIPKAISRTSSPSRSAITMQPRSCRR